MNIKIILGATLISISLIITSNPAYSKTAHLDNCDGQRLSNYKSAKKACKSGNYPGQTIVTCNKKGKLKDHRVCNSSGKRKGIFVGSCGGQVTGHGTLKKGCQSGNYNGQLLVKCKNGVERKRMECMSASSNDPKVVLFKNSCGSDERINGKNLKKACKNKPGELLVKCKKKGNIWKEKKAMMCEGRKDRFKIKKCTSNERATLISDYVIAESRVDIVLADVENTLDGSVSMNKKVRGKMETVRRKLEKIQTAMDRPRTYVCKANKKKCGGANAHTLFTGHKVKLCDYYFSKSSQMERASILVHEISHHKTETNDAGKEHGGCSSPNLARARDNFQRQAEYYEHLIECGLYIPN